MYWVTTCPDQYLTIVYSCPSLQFGSVHLLEYIKYPISFYQPADKRCSVLPTIVKQISSVSHWPSCLFTIRRYYFCILGLLLYVISDWLSTVTIMLFCWIGSCLIDLLVLLISMAIANLLPASIVGYGFILLQYGAFLLLALSAGNLVSEILFRPEFLET